MEWSVTISYDGYDEYDEPIIDGYDAYGYLDGYLDDVDYLLDSRFVYMEDIPNLEILCRDDYDKLTGYQSIEDPTDPFIPSQIVFLTNRLASMENLAAAIGESE